MNRSIAMRAALTCAALFVFSSTASAQITAEPADIRMKKYHDHLWSQQPLWVPLTECAAWYKGIRTSTPDMRWNDYATAAVERLSKDRKLAPGAAQGMVAGQIAGESHQQAMTRAHVIFDYDPDLFEEACVGVLAAHKAAK